jgi:hypothetical protein
LDLVLRAVSCILRILLPSGFISFRLISSRMYKWAEESYILRNITTHRIVDLKIFECASGHIQA